MFRLFFFILFVALIQGRVFGQIKGTVFDIETNTPLHEAYILYENSHTVTDESGNFTINSINDTLIINHLGYKIDTLSALDLTGNISIYLVPNYNQLEQVVVQSGMSRHTLIKMPSSVSLLSKNELAQSSGISYVEKLNQLPGVFVHQGTLSTNRITIRGIGSRSPYATNRIKAYFNGIPLSNGDGSTEIEDVNASVINTIEVLKGSKSSLYGSGLGGVVVISSKNYLKEGLHGSATLEAGSFSTVKPELNIEFKKKKFSMTAGYANTQTDGWRENSGYNRHNFNCVAAYSRKNSTTELVLQAIQTKAFIPSSLNEEMFNNSPSSAAPNWLAVQGYEEYQKSLIGLKHKQVLSSSIKNTTVLFSNFKKAYESRPFNILSDDSKNFGVKNSTVVRLGNFELQGGFEVMIEKYNWSIYETNSGNKGMLLNEFSEDRKPINLFLQSAYNFSNGALIECGVSYNFLTYSLANLSDGLDSLSGNYSFAPVLSPYMGVNIPFKKHWNLYSSVSHGFSAPSVEETLMPSGEINPNLKPETGWNFETGFRLNSEKGNLFFDVNLYLLLVDNLLVTERLSEDIFYGENAGSTQHKGIEVSSMIRFNNHQKYLLPKVTLNFAYNYCDAIFTDFIDDGVSFNNNYLPGIPNMNFWTAVVLKYNAGFYFNGQVQYTGSQFLDDENSQKYNSYLLTHLKLGYASNPSNHLNYEVSIGVKNVFDTHYASMLLVNAPSFGGSTPRYYYPGEPRSFYASVGIRF